MGHVPIGLCSLYFVTCFLYNRNSSRLGHLFENHMWLNPFELGPYKGISLHKCCYCCLADGWTQGLTVKLVSLVLPKDGGVKTQFTMSFQSGQNIFHLLKFMVEKTPMNSKKLWSTILTSSLILPCVWLKMFSSTELLEVCKYDSIRPSRCLQASHLSKSKFCPS